MHRELAHADAVFSRPRTWSLYLFTVFLASLLAIDLLPVVLPWIGDSSGARVSRNFFGVRLATVVAILGGARVLYGALDRLMVGRIGADLALAIACIAALLIGEPLVAAEVVVIGLIGECLEAYTFGRTQAAIGKLIEVFPLRCWVLRNAVETRVLTSEVRIGDRVVVKPGAKIPADGIVAHGQSTLDCSALTGESLPREIGTGDEALAGSLNQIGELTIQVTRVGEQTVAGRVIELTARALGDKAPMERTADRLAAYFLPVVLGLAAITFIVALIGFAQTALIAVALRRATYPALSVLVVACPCPLILATPAAIMAALPRLAGTGILVKSGAALERLAYVKTIAFDKTGTLTEGRLEVREIIPVAGVSADELLRVAASAEQGSEHPLARAVVEAANQRKLPLRPSHDFTSRPGAGVQASVDGETIVVGSLRLMQENGVVVPDEPRQSLRAIDQLGQSPLVVSQNGTILGVLGLRDRVRPEAASVIAQLRESGIEKIALLTGDRAGAARIVADDLGIAEISAELMPEEKAAWVAREISLAPQPPPPQGATGSRKIEKVNWTFWPTPSLLMGEEGRGGYGTAFVGDGINDAPALARAAVGLAVGSGTDIAAESGDIVLMGDPLKSLPLLYRLSRETVCIIRQNIIVFAIGVNAFGVIVTAWLWPLLVPSGEWLESGPLAGVIYHQLGSVAVLLNSMRLLGFERRAGRSHVAATHERWQRFDQWLSRTFNIDEWLHSLSHHWKATGVVISILILAAYAASGFAAIGPAEIGIVNRFGRLLPENLEPGPHWRWPWPMESVIRVRPAEIRTVEIGFRRADESTKDDLDWTSRHRGAMRLIPDESLLVTGDGNQVELLASVRFQIADPRRYLSQCNAPELQLRAAAEAVMREIVASRSFAELLTAERADLGLQGIQLLQKRFAEFGIRVNGISIHDLHPPMEVVSAYHDVARAQEDRDRLMNEAHTEAIRTQRTAEANALRITRAAEARAAEWIATAKTNYEMFAAWRLTRSRLDPGQEATLAGEVVAAILAGGEPESVLADYRKQREERLAIRRSLTEFRLAWDALTNALSGRPKVIIEADQVPGRRHLLLFEPGPLAPPVLPRPAEGHR